MGRGTMLLCILIIGAAALNVYAGEPAWQAVPLVTQAQVTAGLRGGEGGQEIRSLSISQSDPTFLMMGTDVGGIYRSLDAGTHWQICMSGWNARGGNAFAIDPRNADHVIGVGANANDFGPPSNGVYLSIDRGASWKHSLPRNDGNEWRRDSVAFDPASYDRRVGRCMIAYFESRDSGLFKSLDGGMTWMCVNKDRSAAAMKVHPEKGFVYLADNSQSGHGFYKSSDGGKSFRKINDNYILGLDVISTQPDSVYIARWDKILVSTDSGETFRYVGKNEGLPQGTPIQDIRVSPANPKIMACKHGGPQWWESYIYYSDDGGDSWHKPAYDNTLAFLPFTQPDEKCAFHPTDSHIVYSVAGGGWVVKSIDCGKTYAWSNEGENAIMTGVSFNFSVTHPDSIYLAFQDFAGAATLDGGKTWTFRNAAGNSWGGFDYGGYTVDGKTLWCGDAPSWSGTRSLKVSYDGGQTWTTMKDSNHKTIALGAADISFSDPMNDNICFASNFRSTDRGKTWGAMKDCEGVYIASPDGSVLFGRHTKSICTSTNHGETWTDATKPLREEIDDLAVDLTNKRMYAVSQVRLHVFENGEWSLLETPKDQYGQIHIFSVTVDSHSPTTVYAGGPANVYSTSATIVRSVDAGKTWTNLTVNDPIKKFPTDIGPREVQWVRVHPKTRQVWVNGECYGMWKY